MLQICFPYLYLCWTFYQFKKFFSLFCFFLFNNLFGKDFYPKCLRILSRCCWRKKFCFQISIKNIIVEQICNICQEKIFKDSLTMNHVWYNLHLARRNIAARRENFGVLSNKSALIGPLSSRTCVRFKQIKIMLLPSIYQT